MRDVLSSAPDESFALRALDDSAPPRDAGLSRVRRWCCVAACRLRVYLPDLYRASAVVLVERPAARERRATRRSTASSRAACTSSSRKS